MLGWIEVEFGFWQLNTFQHRIINFIVKPYGCLEIFFGSQRPLHTLNQTKPYGPAQPGPVSTWLRCRSVCSKLLKEQVTHRISTQVSDRDEQLWERSICGSWPNGWISWSSPIKKIRRKVTWSRRRGRGRTGLSWPPTVCTEEEMVSTISAISIELKRSQR